jgi:hypothetical protein
VKPSNKARKPMLMYRRYTIQERKKKGKSAYLHNRPTIRP